MEKTKVFKRRGRRKSVSFNPSREYIQNSIQEFLEKGGKITRIERVNTHYQNFVSVPDTQASVDDFLFDR